MNCDFSSNNNIWARFLWWPFWIWLGYLYYDRLIGISRMSFLAAICNFRLRISGSNFRSPSWAFAVYIFCQMESHSGCTIHTLTCLCRFNVVSLSATLAQHWLKQHWFNVLCLKRIATVIRKVSTVHTKYTILVQYWATVCEAGMKLKIV